MRFWRFLLGDGEGFGRRTSPLHLVNTRAAEARLVIGQRLAPGRNEVPGAQQALALLRLDGCTVTADALHCRADTAQAILDAGADYVLALKANRPTLLAQAKALILNGDPATEMVQRPARGHDRVEARSAIVVEATGIDFPGVAAVARVETRCKRAGTPEPVIVRFFLLSTILSPERRIEVARTHWTIENQLHWVLDVALLEDAARSRKDNASKNLALLRKIASTRRATTPTKAPAKPKSNEPDGTTPPRFPHLPYAIARTPGGGFGRSVAPHRRRPYLCHD